METESQKTQSNLADSNKIELYNDRAEDRPLEDKPDNFSDVEDADDSFIVNLETVKNRTTTSNFQFKINITKENNKSAEASRRSKYLDKKDFVEKKEKSHLNSITQKPSNLNSDKNILKKDDIKNKEKEEEKKITEVEKEKEVTQPNINNSGAINNNSTTVLEQSKNVLESQENLQGSGSENEVEGDHGEGIINKAPSRKENESILDFYAKLRENFENTHEEYEDPDFACDQILFCTDKENPDGEYTIEFERPPVEEDNLEFFTVEPHTTSAYNIDHEFKLSRGILNDKFFVGALLMLFQKNSEYFTNLILDYEHINENLKAGFVGFQFFINGEWKEVTIDTKLPAHQNGEFSLTRSLTSKSPFWISLFEKAYAKLHGTYTVLNNTLIKDFLVDFTGGYSKMIKLPKTTEIEEKTKKFYFDEIQRCINQGYLIGCMKYDETKIVDELNESVSDKDGGDDEQILINTIYTVLKIEDYEGLKLIFLCNHWEKGKFTHPYGPEDETWEANKKLTEKLGYTVSTTDGTFWMLFDEFLSSFNTIYYCRIFPESWANYLIAGRWANETSGGSPQKNFPWFPEQRIVVQEKKHVFNSGQTKITKNLQSGEISPKKTAIKYTNISGKDDKPTFSKNTKFNASKSTNKAEHNEEKDNKPMPVIHSKPSEDMNIVCEFKRNIIEDTEEAFFLNPQYKIEVKPNTKLIISLIQKDRKTSESEYIHTNFIVLYTKGRYSRVWDILDTNIIKRALTDKDDFNRREIVMLLDYREIIKKYNSQNHKKLNRNERVFINLIPYMEYHQKYEIEKKGNQRFFKPYHPEENYWLRIFANEDIYINELKKPYECRVAGSWINQQTSGGPRFIVNKKRYVENSLWPINPQYLIKFEGNIKCKIILRKTNGHFANEESKVGILITKPSYYDEDKEKLQKKQLEKHQIVEKEKVKLEPIERILKSTNKILQNRKVDIQKIFPKVCVNESEVFLESSFNNNYCASIQTIFSKLDSPVILMPTLNDKTSSFDYEMKIYSTKEIELVPLYNEKCQTLYGEWNETNSGGSHLSMNDVDEEKKIDDYKIPLTYFDNPKYIIQFDSKDWIKDLDIEIILSRMSSIWKRSLSKSMINAMMSVYIFKYEREGKWKNQLCNLQNIDFMPQNEVRMKFFDKRADPKGFILMPATYNKDVFGPFCLTIKCNYPFTIKTYNKEEDENK